MKKIFFACSAVLLSTLTLTAQQSQNFNAETSRTNLSSQCWIFSGTDLKTNVSYSINTGTEKPLVQTSALTGTPNFLATPFIKFTGFGTLTFKHKLSANNGTTRSLQVYLQDANGLKFGSNLLTYNYITAGGLTTVRTATINYNVTGSYRLVFYWVGTGGNSRGVIDDIAFTTGTFNSDPANACLPIVVCPDADQDGVCDLLDAFPNDPNKAYRSAATIATYGFEDLWPATGDFDYNDAVIWWQSYYVLNAQNQIVALEWKSVTRAAGAGMKNGFAINLPGTNASSVKSVSGNVLKGNYVATAANGCEAGVTNAVIFIYESADDVIKRTGGPFYNTVRGTVPGVSDTVSVNIEFFPLSTQPAIDPFLVANQDRGREIHRAGWAPTTKANSNLFGSAQDETNVGSNRYYVTKNNFPWVIRIPAGFQYYYPLEKVSIIQAHLKFASWAQSGGLNFVNWYENLSGYRDAAKIY